MFVYTITQEPMNRKIKKKIVENLGTIYGYFHHGMENGLKNALFDITEFVHFIESCIIVFLKR